jgi:dihydrofolate reductase
MRDVIYSMSVSLDGFVAGPDGSIAWTAPDDELFRFHTEQIRSISVHLMGRGLYEAMLVWETLDRDPSASEMLREFASMWKAIPKLVFSRSLEVVQGNARLVRGGLAGELGRLKAGGGGAIGIGGATLAGEAARLGLVDEYRAFVCPVAVGGGTPFLPRDHRLDLHLIGTRTFATNVVCLRYRARDGEDVAPRDR